MLKKDTPLFKIIRRIYLKFKDDDVPALAAQLTYYLILSFFPFLIFLITLLSYTPITSERVIRDISTILPATSYGIILDTINQILASRSGTLLSIGMIAAIWTSSNGMNAVIRGINKAYNIDESRPFWVVRGISIIATIALAIGILFSFILLVLGELIGKNLFQFMGFSYLFISVWTIARYIIPILFMLLVFILLYRFTPNNSQHCRDIIPGAVFSTAGWILISILFSFYVKNFNNYSNMYGSIGGVIVLLLWLYWISIIILLGGELNASISLIKKS
ncbi:UNVERIFIED_CONTAM: membrane protein [Acetivibrio alkalicellulosi]